MGEVEGIKRSNGVMIGEICDGYNTQQALLKDDTSLDIAIYDKGMERDVNLTRDRTLHHLVEFWLPVVDMLSIARN